MSDERQSRIKELIATTKTAAMATVNGDGSPHNTPYYFLHDDNFEHFYWNSAPDSLHSKNLMRTGQAFVVLYGAYELGGLYVSLVNARIAKDEEFTKALADYNKARVRDEHGEVDASFYDSGVQNLYIADTKQFWVNDNQRDKNDNIIRDFRVEINREDLL